MDAIFYCNIGNVLTCYENSFEKVEIYLKKSFEKVDGFLKNSLEKVDEQFEPCIQCPSDPGVFAATRPDMCAFI